MNKRYKYSEIFSKNGTCQFEGKFTGSNSVFLRFWGCNLSCMGFSQEFPDKPETWVNPYKNIDPDKYSSVEELPVFELGCDSAYSHMPEFKKFIKQNTASEICDQIISYLPEGQFRHPETKNYYHLVITGGEPMINQNAIVDVMKEFYDRNNYPKHITIETNGTLPISENFKNLFFEYENNKRLKLLFSVSPKLSASGELYKDAIKKDVIKEYAHYAKGQLKFVVDGSEENWNEIGQVLKDINYKDDKNFDDWMIYIMPAGATREQQEKIQASVCEQSYQRGYHFSPRVQNWVFDNVVGK